MFTDRVSVLQTVFVMSSVCVLILQAVEMFIVCVLFYRFVVKT